MATLTPGALEAWRNRERRMVFTTSDANGAPNAIWVLCAEFYGDEAFVIANNSMDKTLENVVRGGRASLLYIAPEREAYQVKGTVEHHPEGPVYDSMKGWLNPDYPGHSAVLLHIEEVYRGSERVA
ncbi:MAG: pyridoxamine 5'-phosphate oxidase family protein [Rhodospirillaceae bacterium]|nr:pyridoxamine 5'-phosphate oxidase family protein [bacterium]MDE0201415.1 pyridoxamine 5'-phosphate oxidase family protein [Rhodospirillaceae bacterium]MDE0416589.1 pyridoxamine 5'-phosphate oxidase family protein [bacterium]